MNILLNKSVQGPSVAYTNYINTIYAKKVEMCTEILHCARWASNLKFNPLPCLSSRLRYKMDTNRGGRN